MNSLVRVSRRVNWNLRVWHHTTLRAPSFIKCIQAESTTENNTIRIRERSNIVRTAIAKVATSKRSSRRNFKRRWRRLIQQCQMSSRDPEQQTTPNKPELKLVKARWNSLHPNSLTTLIPIAWFTTISGTFNSLFKVLFTFPSWYLFAIGLEEILSFRWNLPPNLRTRPRVRDSGNENRTRLHKVDRWDFHPWLCVVPNN